MKYKVQGSVIPKLAGSHVSVEQAEQLIIVLDEVLSGREAWYETDTHLDAAVNFVLDHPEVNCETILVVDEKYNLGSYSLDSVNIAADYQVGLR